MVNTRLWVIGLVLFCAFLGALGQIFFKLSASSFRFNLSLFTNYKFIIGVVLYASATLLFVYTLKFANVSILYPIIATSYIWVALFAHFFLKESFSIVQGLGVLLILGGVFFIVK